MRRARVAGREERLMLIGDKPKINLGRMLCHSLDAISLIPPLFKPSNYKRADRFLVFSCVCNKAPMATTFAKQSGQLAGIWGVGVFCLEGLIVFVLPPRTHQLEIVIQIFVV